MPLSIDAEPTNYHSRMRPIPIHASDTCFIPVHARQQMSSPTHALVAVSQLLIIHLKQ